MNKVFTEIMSEHAQWVSTRALFEGKFIDYKLAGVSIVDSEISNLLT